jgi:pyridoxine 5-phosphate synthase
MVLLGVNIDHVATVREARKTYEPDPVWAAVAAELGGADSITIHVREDRRHIQTHDLRRLRETVHVPLNLEMACDKTVLSLAREVRPDQVTLVPEKREEVTTEGGLDVCSQRDHVRRYIEELRSEGILTSLFLDPDEAQLHAAADLGAEAVELHTGCYAAASGKSQAAELLRLIHAAKILTERQVLVHAGHGLNYKNVATVAGINKMRELNIGHSIVSRALFVGLQVAVREMLCAMRSGHVDP